MPGVFGIVGGDPLTRRARRARMAEALTHAGQRSSVATWGDAEVGVVLRAGDPEAPWGQAGPWRVALEGLAEGVGGAEAVAARLAAEGPGLLGGMDGWHTGAAWDGGALHLYTGFLGVEPLYVHERAGQLVFAPEVKGVVAALDGAPRIDEAACVDLLRFGHPLGTDSLVEGIRTLRHGHRLVFDPDGIRELPIPEVVPPCGPGEVGEWLRATWPSLVTRTLARRGRFAGLLSGGLDSRAVMLPMPASVPALTFGREGTLDVTLAREVARRMGRAHHRLDLPDDFLPRVAGDVVARLDGMINPCHAPGASTNAEVAARAEHLASGAFGDVLMGSRWRETPEGADAVTCLALTLETPPQVEALIAPAFRAPPRERLGRHAAGTPVDEPWRETIRQSFAHHVRRLTAAAIAERRHTTETVHPFYSRDLFAAIGAMPLERRRHGRLYQEFLCALAPALADVPWSRTGVPMFAPAADVARAAAARRRERNLDRLLRNLRLGGRWDPVRYLDVPYLLRTDRRTRAFLLEHLAGVRLPFLVPGAVEALLRAHLSGRGDHSTLLGRVLALTLWAGPLG